MNERKIILSAFALLLLSVFVTQGDFTGKIVKNQSTTAMSSFFSVMGILFVFVIIFLIYKYTKEELTY